MNFHAVTDTRGVDTLESVEWRETEIELTKLHSRQLEGGGNWQGGGGVRHPRLLPITTVNTHNTGEQDQAEHLHGASRSSAPWDIKDFIPGDIYSTEPVFLNVYGAQESIPRN
jgi:hypothetical protein